MSATSKRGVKMRLWPPPTSARFARWNVGSRCIPFACSTGQHERANHSRSPFANVIRRMRGRLALMLAAAADATATPAPGRLLGSRTVSHGGPFATPRTRRASRVIESFSCLSTVRVGEWFWARGQAGKVSGLLTRHFVPRGGERALRMRSPFQFSGFCIFPVASQSGDLR